ncbi:MAG: asparaginase [Pseudomonadota bacterium]
MTDKRKVAIIGTGGTISSLGRDAFDVQDYITLGKMNDAAGMIAHFPEVSELADLIAVPFPPVPSTQIGSPEWLHIVRQIDRLAAEHPDLAGVVILHGTATMEETAYALNLTVKADLPVVITGAQRPATGLSTDGAANMAAAVKTALSPEARGLGVLLVVNEEIQAARDVTKTSTWRLQTFRTPDFGVLGHADADQVVIYRKPVRAHMPDTEFDVRGVEVLPRVDISYSYAGADGTAVRAFVEAGAKGVVSAGLAPGMAPPAEHAALAAAAEAGIAVVQSTRAGSGRVVALTRLRQAGIVPADNLNPQKARILLSLALTVTEDPIGIERIFATY